MPRIVLTDRDTGSTAEIAADVGFNCYAFRANLGGHEVEVLDASPEFPDGGARPSGHGIPILFPFPNRIRGGKYRWEGRDYAIPSSVAGHDAMGNAIHGFCLDRPWRVTSTGADFAVGEFQLSKDAPDRAPSWPADFVLEVRYTLAGWKLRADFRIYNLDSRPLPWGLGTHPYFRLPCAPTSDPARCLIEAPAAEEWVLIDCLPTGERRPVPESKDLRDGMYFDELKLDDVLAGLSAQDGIVESLVMDESAGIEISQRHPDLFRELVVYTPPNRNAVCLEPYTCVTDAINLDARGIDAGWRVLPPGGEFRTWIEIIAGPVVA